MRDARYRIGELEDKLNRSKVQTQSLTDVMLDMRMYIGSLEDSAKWDGKRMEQYRDAIHDIYCNCAEVIDTYKDLPSEEMTLSKREYDLAKFIYEIVRRF